MFLKLPSFCAFVHRHWQLFSCTHGSLPCCWSCSRKPHTKRCLLYPSLAYAVITLIWKKNVGNWRQGFLEWSVRRIPESNNGKLFNLGAEVIEAKKNVQILGDIIDSRLNATTDTVLQLKSQLNNMGDCLSVQHQIELIVDKVHNYISYLDLRYIQ